MNTHKQNRLWPVCVGGCVLAISGCASKPPISSETLLPLVPTLSVDMPRRAIVISSDVELTLNDLESKQQAARQLLTP